MTLPFPSWLDFMLVNKDCHITVSRITKIEKPWGTPVSDYLNSFSPLTLLC